jgi:Rnl2 family RNA ligase
MISAPICSSIMDGRHLCYLGAVSASRPDPSAWRFPSYEKIAESLESWLGDDEAAFRALARAEWIVTEKIHGANFCVVTDGVDIRAAKRKAFLLPGEDFFGHEALLARLAPAVIRLAALARARDASIARLLVYGELFGGGYPHPDVAPDPLVQPVQTGVWYAPGIAFCAFDLGVVREGDEARAYLDHHDAGALFAEAGISRATPLFRGAYAGAIAYPLGFETTIPAMLGLPSLGPTNKAEGVVIKPARGVTLRDGRVIRPVMKRKIPEFAEDARFHEAEKWVVRPAPTGVTREILEREASALVTEARLDAAISKVGRLAPGDGARLLEVIALIVEDMHAEIAARHGALVRALPPAESERLARFVEGEARALVGLHMEARHGGARS